MIDCYTCTGLQEHRENRIKYNIDSWLAQIGIDLKKTKQFIF